MGHELGTGETVVDESGTHFVLAQLIGEGGQGKVFATTAEGVAVKIIAGGESRGRRSVHEERIGRVARMPVADLPVAAPRFVLVGDAVGYTMTLLTGMTSLSELCRMMGEPFDQSWYVGGGGLLKRLSVVESLAELIGTLHGRGLIYCDFSTNNVLVSASPDRARVFLIDLDNLRNVADPPSGRIFTPPFAAPENQTGFPSQASDAFAFAALAFSVLTATNPFYGALLDGMAPDRLDETPFSALAPWIDDPNDSRNRWPHAVPRELTVSPRLRNLFELTFTAGLSSPSLRTPASAFAIAARRARYAVRRCPECCWDNYVGRTNCASCGEVLAGFQLRLYVEGASQVVPFDLCPVVVVNRREVTEVSAAALGFFEKTTVPGLRVRCTGDRWSVELIHDALTFGQNVASKAKDLGAREPLRLFRRNRLALQIRLEQIGDST